jgi:hypothetical protein
MMIRRWLFAALVLVPMISAAADARISGIFTSLKYHEEAGDLLGYEILIVPTGNEWSAVVQVAQGELGVPFVVPVTVKGQTISFPIPDEFGGGSFNGKISSKSLKGTFGNDTVNLRRGKSYWQ